MTQADANVELKPCAHCGGGPYRHEADLEIIAAVAIGCSSCGALGPFVDEANFKTDAEMWSAAEVAWNTRVEPTLHPLPSEENRELRKIIAELGYCTPDASLEFMRLVPTEVRTAMQRSTPTAPVQGDDAEWEAFWPTPWSSTRPVGEEMVQILDARERTILRLEWPFHSNHDADAAEQATYALADYIASRLSGDNNAALVEALSRAKLLIGEGGQKTELPEIVREGNLNEAWHLLNNALASITGTDADGGRRG